MSCGVGCRHGSDPTLLRLWCRRKATAPIQPLAWEPPYAASAVLKSKQTNKQTNKTNNKKTTNVLGSSSEILVGMGWSGKTSEDDLPSRCPCRPVSFSLTRGYQFFEGKVSYRVCGMGLLSECQYQGRLTHLWELDDLEDSFTLEGA